jgi:CIC family chloride channel protein
MGNTHETGSSRARAPNRGLVRLAWLSLLTGAGTGLVVGVFRLALERGDAYRNTLVDWAHQWPVPGFLIAVASIVAATTLAVWLVRRSGQPAGGSGIPHVEAVLSRDLPAAPLLLLPVKFVGGLLAISAGLALGREGPSVQMGANLGAVWGKSAPLSDSDRLALIAAGAGAGLATAFNAPIAGAVFVLEELVRRFDARIALAALGASGAAIAVARLLIGPQPDFHLDVLPESGFFPGLLFVVLGIFAGFAGVAYNHAILGFCAMSDRFTRSRPELRGAVIGVLVGALAWFAPDLVGGGDALTQAGLAGQISLTVLPLLLVVRFLLGPLSYAAGAPGGLFAPMLVLGAYLGLAFGLLCQFALSDAAPPPVAFAVAGMAAFFTAVVRAPVTGIILSIELTAAFNQLLPMLWACFAAMAVPVVLGNPPIYDSLKQRILRGAIFAAKAQGSESSARTRGSWR